MLSEMPVEPAVRKAGRNQPPEHAVAFDPDPETVCYRGQTLAIVRNFFEMSCQLGRLPSILGREFFRAKVSHHAIPSFEDQALFAHDVERSLMKLDKQEMDVLTLVGLYDLNLDEAAEILHWSTGYISQRFAEALARLTQIFLDSGLLRRDRPDRRQVQMQGRKPPASVLPPKKPCGSVRHALTDQQRRAQGAS
ncbi:MAG: sigma factor-like helix-turn-helix DNA-binding protein [Candidatus Korobacteraceae bacterium]